MATDSQPPYPGAPDPQWGERPSGGHGQQYGAEQYGAEQYGAEQYGAEQYGSAPYGSAPYGSGPYGAAPYGPEYGPEYGAAGYPPPYGSPYPVYAPQYVVPTSGLAVGSLVCSLVGLITLGLGSIPGVILGHMALPETRSGERGGHGLAIAGLVVGYIQIAGWLVFWAFAFLSAFASGI